MRVLVQQNNNNFAFFSFHRSKALVVIICTTILNRLIYVLECPFQVRCRRDIFIRRIRVNRTIWIISMKISVELFLCNVRYTHSYHFENVIRAPLNCASVPIFSMEYHSKVTIYWTCNIHHSRHCEISLKWKIHKFWKWLWSPNLYECTFPQKQSILAWNVKTIKSIIISINTIGSFAPFKSTESMSRDLYVCRQTIRRNIGINENIVAEQIIESGVTRYMRIWCGWQL